MFPVAILAGGLAKRLRPITKTIPKSLVKVAGKPFIMWQLKQLKEQGISEVVICVGHFGEMIRNQLKKHDTLGLKISFSEDGKDLLGTGGALRKALDLLGEKFFILYGDSYLPINFLQVEQAYKKKRKSALMTIVKNKNQWDKSNVFFENGEIIEYNKHSPSADMSFIDYGLSIMSASIINQYGLNETFDLSDVYHKLSIKGKLGGFEVKQRFYEIGSHKGLSETETYFSQKGEL